MALHASEKERNRLQRYLDVAGALFVMIDPNQKVSLINTRGCEVLGYSRDEIIGKNWFDTFIPEKNRDQVRDVFQKLLSGEAEPVEYFENPLLTKGGEEKVVAWHSTFLRDDAGKIIGTLGSGLDITEQKKTQESLKASEAFSLALFDHNPMETIVVDREGRVTNINLAMKNSGHRLPDIGNVMYKDFADKHDIDMYAELKDSIETNALKSFPELKYGDRFLTVTISPFYAGAIITSQDITEHKRSDQALHKSEERFRRIIESNADGMVLVDNQGTIRFTNPAAQRLFGREESDLIGDVFGFPLVSGETTEIGIVRRGDGVVPTEMRVVGIEMNEGSAYLAALRDITDRKRSEEVLRKSEERYRTIFEGSKDAIFISSEKEGRFIDYNRATLDLFGYSGKEIKGITAKDIYVDLPDRKRMQAKIQQQGFVRDYEVKFRKKDGQVIDSLLTASVWESSDGTRGFQGMVRDITERKRAAEEKGKLEAQLRHAQKMEAVGTLAGGVAHDFNNLLTTILGNASLLLRDMNTLDPIYEEVDDIKKAAQRAASLTRQLLTFSRKQVSQPIVLKLNEVIAEMKRMVIRVIGEDIELETALEPELWRVKADIGQMEQVIMNLVVNARDAMANGGKITVETANVELSTEFFRSQGVEPKPGSYVMMSVQDTGTGMDETTISKIFEPFFTTKARGKGTGLGLSTVYGIVTQSGGNIWVQSGPGKGSTFSVYLPRVAAHEKSKEENKTAPDGINGEETILIVEDDDALRLLTQKALKKYGYTVLQAKDGKNAISHLEKRKETVHLMLTDVVMPGMSGKELGEHAQALRPEMKVLYMSGYANNVIAHHGVLDTGIAFIEKPFTTEKLGLKVREVLDS